MAQTGSWQKAAAKGQPAANSVTQSFLHTPTGVRSPVSPF